MKPTDVIRYLPHYIGCPFRYEDVSVHEGVENKYIVFSKVDTLITDEYMTVFEGTCNGEPLEEYFVFFDSFDKFRLILTHPAKLTTDQLKVFRQLKGNQIQQVVYCFEQFIDMFGWIDAGLALDASPNRYRNTLSVPSILQPESVRNSRRDYQRQYRKKLIENKPAK